MVSRFIRSAASLGLVLGVVAGFHAAQQEQSKKAPATGSDSR